MAQIRLVCFDIGGVLVRHCRSWGEGLAMAGLEVRGGRDVAEMAGRRKELAHRLTIGGISEEAFYIAVAETTGGLYSAEEVRRVHRCWLGEEYAGVRAVVERLVGEGEGANGKWQMANSKFETGNGGVVVGVLSNTNGPHWRQLEDRARYPAVNLIREAAAARGEREWVLASHLLGVAKPDPEIFRVYQERAGVEAREILFLEDLPENAAAARAAGWNVAEIDHTRETAEQIAGVLESYAVLGRCG